MATRNTNVPARASHGAMITRLAVKAGIETNTYIATVKKTVMPSTNATDEQVAAFLSVADVYELNPFTKEIFAFPARGGGIVPVVSVDGWSTLINRQTTMDGVEFVDEIGPDGKLLAITCKIYRKDRSHATEVTEYMEECSRDTEVWKKWPRRMLRHKALIQCARLAFGLSGIYDQDEAERIDSVRGGTITAVVPSAPAAPSAIKRLTPEAKERGEREAARRDAEDARTDDVPYANDDAPAHDADTGEIADDGEAGADGEKPDPLVALFEKFSKEIARCKTEKALDAIWEAYSGDMPQDDSAWVDVYQKQLAKVSK